MEIAIGCRAIRNVRYALFALLLTAGSGCANPFPPVGGPEDRTPPAVVSVVPADRAVNVSADVIEITFSEHVDQGTFLQAFSITPEFQEPPGISWRGRTVRIRFPVPLRPNTTYLLQIDTNLRDLRRVPLSTPITMAFATGPEINRGVIRGSVRDARSGDGAASVDVFAYTDAPAVPASASGPDYRTQTDSEGRFEFRYLPEGVPFFVAAVADENRNRRPDVGERFAPPPRAIIVADSIAEEPDRPWVMTEADSVAVETIRARPLSSRRVAVRFSRAVHLLDVLGTGWKVTSQEGATYPIRAIYVSDAEPREVVVVTDSLTSGIYEILPAALVDSSGNPVQSRPVSFEPLTRPDTVRLRFLGFGPGSMDESELTLPPGSYPSVRFSLPPGEPLLRQMVSVIDSTGETREFTPTTTTGTRWDILADPSFAPGDRFSLQVRMADVPDTTFTRTYRRMPDSELGEISGVVRYAASDRIVIEVFSAGQSSVRRTAADASGSFVLEELPAGQYAVRAFADRDSSWSWSGGLLVPYAEPEPITWLPDSVRVRARWETALEDTLRLVP